MNFFCIYLELLLFLYTSLWNTLLSESICIKSITLIQSQILQWDQSQLVFVSSINVFPEILQKNNTNSWSIRGTVQLRKRFWNGKLVILAYWLHHARLSDVRGDSTALLVTLFIKGKRGWWHKSVTERNTLLYCVIPQVYDWSHDCDRQTGQGSSALIIESCLFMCCVKMQSAMKRSFFQPRRRCSHLCHDLLTEK